MCQDYFDKGYFNFRDLKPSNILLLVDGDAGSTVVDWKMVPVKDLTVKITDFGISRHFDFSRDSANEAITMSVVGTELFMAPEIFESYAKKKQVTKYNTKADIYSAGRVACVMYYKYKQMPGRG